MVGAIVVLLLPFAAQPAADDPRALVDRLGSPRYAEREAAARTLESLGRAALVPLRHGRDSRDLEIRTRAAALVERIEGALLTQPTLVMLDFKDAPLAEVVRALARRSGMRVALFPEVAPRWQRERLSLEEPRPVPFWKAIDRVCGAAGLQSNLELHGFTARSGPVLALTDRLSRAVHPVADSGPFRVGLVGLEFQRHVTFAAAEFPRAGRTAEPVPNPPRAVVSVQCAAQLEILAEPRLGIRQNGSAEVLEARDERGNSLLMSASPSPAAVRDMTYLVGACSSVVHLRLPLQRPDDAGRTIKVLRGTVPLKVTARQPDPLVVPLAGAAGKSFSRGGLHVVVHEVRSDPDSRQRQIELSVRVDQSSAEGPEEPAARDFSLRSETLSQNIELVDERGEVLPWFQTSTDVASSRITLTLSGLAGAEPRELRCYELREAAATVPFAFTDVPMP